MTTLRDPHFDTAWLQRAGRDGAPREDVLVLFDRLPPVPLDAMLGRWRGGGLPTGHVLDGMLEALGWWGKAFESEERVFPLLFGRQGEVSIDPARLPVRSVAPLRMHRLPLVPSAFRLMRPLLATNSPGARLREVRYRGVTSATMLYDAHPIHDHFRAVTSNLLLGLMDLRGLPPFFFTLRREP